MVWFVACGSVNWNWPEEDGVSTAGPRFNHWFNGNAIFVEDNTVKGTPLPFVKPNWNKPLPSFAELFNVKGLAPVPVETALVYFTMAYS